ncbi:MAG: hypothetical protein JWO00_329 [Candidatus Parcubacteria bacterium]|nr:hypothetical protein [Candidatus Parcubacteria bacterium]
MSGYILPDGTIEPVSNIVEDVRKRKEDSQYVPKLTEIIDRVRNIVQEFQSN